MKTGGRRYCTVVHFGPLPVIKACCNGFAMHSVFFELSFCKETFLGLSCIYGEVMGNLKRYYPINTIMHLLKNEPVWECGVQVIPHVCTQHSKTDLFRPGICDTTQFTLQLAYQILISLGQRRASHTHHTFFFLKKLQGFIHTQQTELVNTGSLGNLKKKNV